MIIKGSKGTYRVVIGLEVHARMMTKFKLFSNSKNEFSHMQNSNVSMLDIAMPGVLPVLHEEAIKIGIMTGIAINGNISQFSRFDRKHYFYPDLPLGYQITQFYEPLVKSGKIDILLDDGSQKTIRINRIHIEQDAGKLVHDRLERRSCIDYNRAGSPLMEIVTEPDISSPVEAVKYLKELHIILKTIGACDGDMENGSFRCDANVSVMMDGASEFGKRCEIKNLNSFKFVAKAIEYEANRHVELIESGKSIVQQTMLFDSVKEVTIPMRDKEDSDDYYYFPDPDLLPIKLEEDYINEIASKIPELPQKKRERYIKKYGLSAGECESLIENISYCKYFDYLVEKHDTKSAFGMLMTELVGRLNKANISIDACMVSKEALRSILDCQKSGKISGKMGKDILDEVFSSGKNVDDIISEKGYVQIDDDNQLIEYISKVINDNPKEVAEYKAGRDKLLGFFVGQAMKLSKGSANPQKLSEIAVKLLSQ